MNKDEALHMALNALEPDPELAEWYVEKHKEMAIKVIKEALAQPEREWVELTPAEFDWLEQVFGNKVSNNFVLAEIVCVISAKLKEKNT